MIYREMSTNKYHPHIRWIIFFPLISHPTQLNHIITIFLCDTAIASMTCVRNTTRYSIPFRRDNNNKKNKLKQKSPTIEMYSCNYSKKATLNNYNYKQNNKIPLKLYLIMQWVGSNINASSSLASSFPAPPPPQRLAFGPASRKNNA